MTKLQFMEMTKRDKRGKFIQDLLMGIRVRFTYSQSPITHAPLYALIFRSAVVHLISGTENVRMGIELRERGNQNSRKRNQSDQKVRLRQRVIPFHVHVCSIFGELRCVQSGKLWFDRILNPKVCSSFQMTSTTFSVYVLSSIYHSLNIQKIFVTSAFFIAFKNPLQIFPSTLADLSKVHIIVTVPLQSHPTPLKLFTLVVGSHLRKENKPVSQSRRSGLLYGIPRLERYP